jgi:hypothetical protein
LEIAPGEVVTVYRVVRTADQVSPEFVDDFRSRSELGLPPRRNTPEDVHPQVHEGISVFRSREALTRVIMTARRAGRDLGGYVAELQLTADVGVTYHEWGSPGHLTLWGDAVKLSEAVVDTIEVARE